MNVSNVLVAVSGGSDSMALLDMLVKKNKYRVIVAHINYHYRDSANRDQKIVEKYCKTNNLKYYILDLDSKKECNGNFENWARVKRYKFFKEIYDKENCNCLFLGHHKDDLIETYLMQLKRGSTVEYYGLKQETDLQGMRVIRPLLNFTKQELENYCNDNHLEYGIDETNFDSRYLRNKIRKEVIYKLSKQDSDKYLKEIQELNDKRQKELNEVDKNYRICLRDKRNMYLDKFASLSNELKREILYRFIIDNVYEKISIKESRIKDMIKKISSNKPNIELAKYTRFTLYKEYDMLVMAKNSKEYCYEIDDLKTKEISDRFSIENYGHKLEKVVASKSAFPLYLKNYDGTNVKINRIFIDKKIPQRERERWPVLVDKFGVLLLVINIKKFYNVEQSSNEELVEFYIRDNKGE